MNTNRSQQPCFLSIVTPVFRAAELVDELVRQIAAASSEITEDWEIILVDDRSPDASWESICAAAARDPRVRGVRLSRNFGQHIAISAGLAHARGDYGIVMDCDLQDDPAYIPVLLKEAQRGFDIVYTRKVSREHPPAKNLFARGFHRFFNWLSSGDPSDEQIGAYSLLSRRVIDAFIAFEDRHRHYLALLRWLGFSSTVISIEHRPRPSGKSSYSFAKLVNHAVDGIVSHSTRLLSLTVIVGLSFCAAAFCAVGYIVWFYFVHGFREGWASIATLILGSTGIILCSLGVLGLYVGRMFEQVKGRPLYVVADSRNLDPEPLTVAAPGRVYG